MNCASAGNISARSPRSNSAPSGRTSASSGTCRPGGAVSFIGAGRRRRPWSGSTCSSACGSGTGIGAFSHRQGHRAHRRVRGHRGPSRRRAHHPQAERRRSSVGGPRRSRSAARTRARLGLPPNGDSGTLSARNRSCWHACWLQSRSGITRVSCYTADKRCLMNRSVLLLLCTGALALAAGCSGQQSSSPSSTPPDNSTSPYSAPNTTPPPNNTPPGSEAPGTPAAPGAPPATPPPNSGDNGGSGGSNPSGSSE